MMMKYEDTLRLRGVTAMPGFDEIASGYGYNLRSLRDALTKQSKEIEYLDRQVKQFRKSSILDTVVPLFKQKRLEKALENYEEKLMSWKSFFGASYPEIRRDDGKQVHQSCLLERIPKNIGDGYYHVKGHSHTQSDKNSVKILEECSQIPYAVGKALEELWNQPGDTYVHATPIKEDSFHSLGSIMHDGLACNGNNIQYTAFKVESFPDFMRYVCSSCYYHQDSCHGAIILKAQDMPEVIQGRISSRYVAGYVSCVDAHLHGFAGREELLKMNVTEHRIKEVFQQIYDPGKYWCIVKHDKDLAHVYLDDKFGKGFHLEQYISMEAVLSENYHEEIKREIDENEKNVLFIHGPGGDEPVTEYIPDQDVQETQLSNPLEEEIEL